VNQHLAGYSRWHLLKNLRDALEKFLTRHRKAITEIAKEFRSTSSLPASYGTSKRQLAKATSKLRVRQERIQRARALFAKYNSIIRVARELPASKTFVYKAMRSEDLPELRNNAHGGSLLDRWVPELELRFARGLRNGRQFWRELREIGFEGVGCVVHGSKGKFPLWSDFVGGGFGAWTETAWSCNHRSLVKWARWGSGESVEVDQAARVREGRVRVVA
jgi:hypothetical protein